MSGVLNPADIEAKIQECSNRIHAGVTACTKAEREARRLRREYDKEYARAYRAADGPAHEKRYIAELATAQAREDAETAEVSYKYAERTAKAVELELRAWQSVGASIRAMYSAETGVGR